MERLQPHRRAMLTEELRPAPPWRGGVKPNGSPSAPGCATGRGLRYIARMGNFMGGSAWAMAQQIGDGFILVSERTFKRLDRGEIEKLAFEIDKLMREVRGTQAASDELTAVQQRHRKLSRLTGAMSQLRSYQVRMR